MTSSVGLPVLTLDIDESKIKELNEISERDMIISKAQAILVQLLLIQSFP
ncbi:hypothetical protein [Enterobacter mori]